MTELIRIKKRLENFGLNKNQADIYILLLRKGGLRINEITKILNLPRSSVYEHLKGLLDLGLTEELVENSYRIIKPYPISSIRHHLDEKISLLQKQTTDLEHLEKSLKVLPDIKTKTATNIRYYKGRSGAQQLFWNTLKAKNTLYVYSEWGRGRYVGINFYKKFVAESYHRGFKEHVLTNPTPRVLDSIREHMHSSISRTELENIRCIDKAKVIFRGDSLIYDNVYAQIFLKDEQINGFEIESQNFVNMQRAIFENLWDQAVPIEELL